MSSAAGPVSSPAAPDALQWSVEACTIGRAMEILGEKWTIVVLREVFAGIRRFDDMRVRTHIPRQVLTNRLATLVDHGVLHRVPYQEPGARARSEYRLTDKGFDLYPVLIALAEWGDRHLADPAGPPLVFAHRDCGAPVHAVVTCDDGHAVGELREVLPKPGPGARRR
ncbi:helix-turn-helix transcriptional regulator [Actinoplanes sp. LDG1-06]|uniref:Helix-turn-helix transcriptional regulator n=1 Tax=Paractinoplanes ovalisporus TaxID=2810368 RepID=A0ABS2ARD9_9ACTN|nr:helix-turn-helix domain-containing protein [Actinoplanes ovalisporus]MBM2622308.1 helix-turn-helix transcriptional regulator [Actinoplanes ovalisporus]